MYKSGGIKSKVSCPFKFTFKFKSNAFDYVCSYTCKIRGCYADECKFTNDAVLNPSTSLVIGLSKANQ